MTAVPGARVAATIVVMLMFLELVADEIAQESATHRAEEAVVLLVAQVVAGGASDESAA